MIVNTAGELSLAKVYLLKINYERKIPALSYHNNITIPALSYHNNITMYIDQSGQSH